MQKYKLVQYKTSLVKERTLTYDGSLKVDESKPAAEFFYKVIGNSPVELMVSLHLNAALNISGFEILSKGGSSGCAVIMADVFRGAIVSGARSIIIGHNHPSGNVYPSDEDISITKSIVSAGNILGIRLLDHLIVDPIRKKFNSLSCMGYINGNH